MAYLSTNGCLLKTGRKKRNFMGKCIIVSAGEYDPVPVTREEDDFVIAADNGLSYLHRMGMEPDYVIGDFDSLTEEGKGLLEEFRRRHPDGVRTLPAAKDYTDTMECVMEGFERGYTQFEILCALGRRLDHTLCNLQTLQYIKGRGGRGRLRSSDGEIQVLRDETADYDPHGRNGYFSLFAVEDIVHVDEKGLRWELKDYPLRNDMPIGQSNWIRDGSPFTVTVRGGSAIAIVTYSQ